MKTKLLSLLFVLCSSILKSQEVEKKEFYFGLKLAEQSLLDSLEIPYLSILDRNGGCQWIEIDTDETQMSNYTKFFWGEFVFSPDRTTSGIKLWTFFQQHNFLTDDDELYLHILSSFDSDIIGNCEIELNNNKYKTCQIVEYRCNTNNTYGTMVLVSDFRGFWKFIY